MVVTADDLIRRAHADNCIAQRVTHRELSAMSPMKLLWFTVGGLERMGLECLWNPATEHYTLKREYRRKPDG